MYDHKNKQIPILADQLQLLRHQTAQDIHRKPEPVLDESDSS
ncbi:unnamed protein product, partial [Rotaria sp. Silwood2]